MHIMAIGTGSGAHSACTGREGRQNRISGSLPAEIGKLSSLVDLYGPSLSLSVLEPWCILRVRVGQGVRQVYE